MRVNGRKAIFDPHFSGPVPVRGARPRSAPAPEVDDLVSVSSTAREMAILRLGVGPLDLLRPERVSGLRTLMAEGSYSADFRNVARDFLCDLLGLLPN